METQQPILWFMAMISPSFHLEKKYPSYAVVGIDEAGCGPWAGPVVAAAVIIDQSLFPETFKTRVNDSKKLTKKQRQTLFQELILHPCLTYHIGLATVEEIDFFNISHATRLAMRRAVDGLKVRPSYALVDGIRKPELECSVEMVVKGDQSSFSIATASILAKVERDKIMNDLHQDFPVYGWDKNAGYGTLLHRQALRTYGVTLHHRRSFAPIRALLPTVV